MSGSSQFWVLVIRAMALVSLGASLYYQGQGRHLPGGLL